MESNETYTIKSLFYQGAYAAVISTLATLPEPSQSSLLSLFAARAHLALGDKSGASSVLSPLPASIGKRAVSLISGLSSDGTASSSAADTAREILAEVEAADDAGEEDEEDEFGSSTGLKTERELARATAGTVLYLAGETQEAIDVLQIGVERHEGESVSVLIHILLLPAINRVDLARQVHSSAKAWAEDATWIQVVESWIGLKTGGAALQQAYYVYEETSQIPGGGVNVTALNGKGISQATLGRWEEAQTEFQLAAASDAKSAVSLANLSAIYLPSGRSVKDSDDTFAKLSAVDSQHVLVADLAEKEKAFDAAAAKFTAATA